MLCMKQINVRIYTHVCICMYRDICSSLVRSPPSGSRIQTIAKLCFNSSPQTQLCCSGTLRSSKDTQDNLLALVQGYNDEQAEDCCCFITWQRKPSVVSESLYEKPHARPSANDAQEMMKAAAAAALGDTQAGKQHQQQQWGTPKQEQLQQLLRA